MIELVTAMVGAMAVFVGVGALTGQFGYSQRRIAARTVTLQRGLSSEGSPEAPRSVLLKESALSGNARLSSLLSQFSWASSRAQALDKADIPLKVSEYGLILVALFAVTVALVAFISGLFLVGLAFGAGAVLGAEMWLKSRARSRLGRFNQQLPTALQSMSVSLKSGFGIMEAVATVCREMDDPVAAEFQRVLDEARIGGSFEDGLAAMVARVDSGDLRIVARALEIHRSVGGDLSQILDTVAATMREREDLRGHIKALTAQQRLGGMIVSLLPIWVVGFFLVTNPDFISPLWEDTAGRILLAAGVAMEALAFVGMRKVMSIEV